MSKYDVEPLCTKTDCDETMYYEGSGYWKCPKCGREEYLGYDDEGESTEESLDRIDASLIYRSSGRDEDYMFGYSEEELE